MRVIRHERNRSACRVAARVLLFAALVAGLALPGSALAQKKKKKNAGLKDRVAELETAGEEQEAEVESRLEELEQKLSEQRTRIDDLESDNAESEARAQSLASKLEAVRDKQTEVELDALDEAPGGGGSGFEKRFQFWGFFDLTFSRYFYPDDAAYNMFITKQPTFLMSNVNLYFASQMTETLSALVETRFSFMPHGHETSYEIEGVSEYERTDTTVLDPFTSAFYRQHGVTLERVHLTWAPADWFNVLAGRYLTPYGIWNVDHGSPVVIPIRVPYLQLREMVPLSQTGLQVRGRLFPLADLYFDYAVTFSNGRGPMDEVHDLDSNKGAGLRLRLEYDGDPVRVAAGGYGYYGKVSDTREVVTMELTDEGQLDTSAELPIRDQVVTTSRYDEVVASADLLVELFGVRLQGEYVWRRWDVSKPKVRDEAATMFDGGQPGDAYYAPGFIGWGVYGMLAYELPLQRWIAPVRITPYILCEVNRHDDTLEYQNLTTFIGGLNVKPSPYVTLKLEGGIAVPQEDYLGGTLKSVAAQLAVSF